MSISKEEVKQLRAETGVGIMDCKRALQESDGDMKKAKQILREEGMEMSEGAGDTGEGLVEAYIHHDGKTGVLVEVKTQTDFAAKSDEVKDFVKTVTMHIAAAAPEFVSREDVPEDRLEEEKEIYRKQAKKEGKPEDVIDKIVEGKIDKFFEENCLLEQEYIGEEDETIEEMLGDLVAKVNENVEISRFVRFSIGSDSEGEEEEELEIVE